MSRIVDDLMSDYKLYKSHWMHFRVDEDTYILIKLMASDYGCTQSALIRIIVMDWLRSNMPDYSATRVTAGHALSPRDSWTLSLSEGAQPADTLP